MSLRRPWLQAHRWLALTLGVPLAFVGTAHCASTAEAKTAWSAGSAHTVEAV